MRYVQAWAAAVARKQIEHKAEQMLNGPQEAPIAQAEFRRRMAQGLYPKDTTWKPITSKAANGPSTPHPLGLGRIVYSEAHVAGMAKAMGATEARGRAERYLGKIDVERMEAFEKLYRQQEAQWQERLALLETDRVAWLEGAPFETCMRHTFDERKAFCGKQRTRDELRIDIAEACALIRASDCAYGSPAVTPVMLKHLARIFGKKEDDPTHWVAKALISEFDFFDKIAGDEPDDGMRADLYDATLARREGWEQFNQGWAMVRDTAAQFSANLLHTAQQATSALMAAAIDAERARRFGFSMTLRQAAQKRVIWVRATALQHFMATGSRQYFVGLKWKAGAFFDASVEAIRPPMVEVKFNSHASRQHQSRRSAAASAQAQLRKLRSMAGMDAELVVPVLMDEATMRSGAASRGGKTIHVVSSNLLGLPQSLVEVPEDFARQVLRDQELFRQGWSRRLQEKVAANKIPAATGATVMLLQAFALEAAIDDFSKKGGLAQADAAAAMLASALGVVGAGAEVGYMLAVPQAASATPVAAQAVSQVPRHLALRFAAGLLGAAGAFLDVASASAKGYLRIERGDYTSGLTHVGASTLHLAGGIGMACGAYLSWKSSLFARAAVQGAVRVGMFPLMGVSALSGFGLLVTGVGLLLWVGAVTVGIVATMLEEDQCDEFLDRTYFGRGRNSVMKRFQSMEEEALSLGSLAQGIKVELEWNDETLGPDVVTANLVAMDWDPKQRAILFTAEGYDAINGNQVETLGSGEVRMSSPAGRDLFHRTSISYPVRRSEVKAVKLSFTVYDTTDCVRHLPHANKTSLVGAVKIATSHIWIDD